MAEVTFSVEEVNEVDRAIRLEIPRDLYDKRFDEILNRRAQQVHLKGFRPGRAPRAMVAKHFGSEIRKDLLGELISSGCQQAIQDHSLRVVGDLSLQFPEDDEGETLQVIARLSVLPELKITDYFDLEFEVEVAPFSEAEVDEVINVLRRMSSRREVVNDSESASASHVVTVDIRPVAEDLVLLNKPAKEYQVELGAGRFSKQLEEGLIGVRVGDTTRLTIPLPDEVVEPGCEGKEFVCEIVVKKIEKILLPELNDEFAKNSGIAQTIKEFRTRIHETIFKSHEENKIKEKSKKLLEVLAEKCHFQIPQVMVDSEIRHMLYKRKLISVEVYRRNNFDVSSLREHLGAEAETTVRNLLIIDFIADQENCEVDHEEVEDWVRREVDKANHPRSEIERALGLPDREDVVKVIVRREKMVRMLLEKAKVNEVIIEKTHAQDKAPNPVVT